MKPAAALVCAVLLLHTPGQCRSAFRGFGRPATTARRLGGPDLFSFRHGNALAARGGGADDDEDEMTKLREEWRSIAPASPSVRYPPPSDRLGDSDGVITKAIVIVDGFCPYHGGHVAESALIGHGAAVINVCSDFVARFLHRAQGRTDHLSSRMPDGPDELEAWRAALPPDIELRGVYCESDSGLDDAERLGTALGLNPTWHDGWNPARRDKFLMNEALAARGMDTVRQRSCGTEEEAAEFAGVLGLGETKEGENGNAAMAVVKPLRGVASDDVHLCRTIPSVRSAFSKIKGSQVFGSARSETYDRVLVQEFAAGTEYAVDIVCRDGQRKAVALWRYDKRPANGAPFVYHATRLVSAGDEDDRDGVGKAVCEYAFGALDALGVRWGLSHVEVIAETRADGTVRTRLVEVNCRQHNTDFVPLVNAVVGYNALDVVVAAHLEDGDAGEDDGFGTPQVVRWDDVPTLPSTRAHGAIVHLVSHVEGRISGINFDVLAEMESLPSVVDMHVYPQFMEVGNEIERTVDIRTDSGWIHLLSPDGDEFEADYGRIVELQRGMFDVEEETN